jgi:ABC-type amino acid transport substrate-binding protein
MTLAFLQSSIRFASGLLAGVLLATLIGPADAEATRLDAIVKGGVLRVGLTEDYRPFSFAEAAGKVEGIDAAYVNQWLNLLDLSGERQAILARWMP